MAAMVMLSKTCNRYKNCDCYDFKLFHGDDLIFHHKTINTYAVDGI